MGCVMSSCSVLGCSCCATQLEDPVDGPKLIMIEENRKCTDIFFLLLFIASIIGVGAVLVFAIDKGADHRRLIKPTDLNNKICGVDEEVKNTTDAVWPWISPDILLSDEYSLRQLLDLKICVPSCDVTNQNTSGKVLTTYKSKEIFHFCIPDINDGQIQEIASSVADVTNINDNPYTRFAADISTASTVMIFSGLIAIFFSLLYIVLCRYFAKWLVWSTCLMVVGGAFLLAYLLNTYSTLKESTTDAEVNSVKVMRYLSYFVFCVGQLLLIIILISRNRLRIAIEIIRESSKAVYDMPGLFLVPFGIFVLGILYFFLWVYIAIMIFSVKVEGKTYNVPSQLAGIISQPTYTTQEWDESLRNTFAFHFFHLLWFIQVLIYGGHMILCGALAEWYFSKVNEQGKKVRGNGEHELSRSPVWNSMIRLLRYNLGTVCFAALFIAIIKFIRAIIAYLEKNFVDQDSKFQKCLFRTVMCVVYCFERCIDSINSIALVYCSIQGESLCKSGANAASIALRNISHVLFLKIVGELIIFVGKFAVAFSTTAIAALILTSPPYDADIRALFVPCLIIFYISYLVASSLLLIYENSIDTLSFCFMIDYDKNKGGHMFAAPSLSKLVDKYKSKSLKEAKLRSKYRKHLPETDNNADEAEDEDLSDV